VFVAELRSRDPPQIRIQQLIQCVPGFRIAHPQASQHECDFSRAIHILCSIPRAAQASACEGRSQPPVRTLHSPLLRRELRQPDVGPAVINVEHQLVVSDSKSVRIIRYLGHVVSMVDRNRFSQGSPVG
jgi:hypothetical protein